MSWQNEGQGCLVPDVPWTRSEQIPLRGWRCVPGSGCPAPWLLPANLASPDCFPCSGKPHGHAPTVGQLVLRGALAKNNPADVRSPENLLHTSPKTATKTFQGKAGRSSLTHWFGPCASIITCVTERGLQC